ncbi:MAG: hypothetical protein GWO02_19215, partial [Gammaproteobacteria bacterium]|nr:hypothetical protein [Gammaproteobacteria bacterium]
MKAVVQLVWLGVIVGYPLLIGSSPSAFYADAFALPAPIATMGTLVVACLAGFALINLAGWAVGGIVFERLYSGP